VQNKKNSSETILQKIFAKKEKSLLRKIKHRLKKNKSQKQFCKKICAKQKNFRRNILQKNLCKKKKNRF
jgi:hypothetical protein